MSSTNIFSKSLDIKFAFNQLLGLDKRANQELSVKKNKNRYVLSSISKFSEDTKEFVNSEFGEDRFLSDNRLSLELDEWLPLYDFLKEESFPLLEGISASKTASNTASNKEEKSTLPTPTSALNKYEEVRKFIDSKGFDKSNYTQAEIDWLYHTYEGAGGLAKEGIDSTGILSEFYTPEPIIEKMWGLAKKYGFKKDGKVLEPSCGVGRFLEFHNPVLVDAYEIDKYSHFIASAKFPKATIYHKSFEELFFLNGNSIPATPKYDLVIGNPPYGDYRSKFSKTEKERTGVSKIEQYFIHAGIELLNKGGLLIMIVPSYFQRNEQNYNTAKTNILEMAELVDAYRLPNDVFPNTYVGTDILVFKKK